MKATSPPLHNGRLTFVSIFPKTPFEQHRASCAAPILATWEGGGGQVAATIQQSAVSLHTIVNHLQVKRLSLVDVVQVFHSDDEAELQDGQTWNRPQRSRQTCACCAQPTLNPPCSMLALASVKHSLLASSRSAARRVGRETETRLRQNIWRHENLE